MSYSTAALIAWLAAANVAQADEIERAPLANRVAVAGLVTSLSSVPVGVVGLSLAQMDEGSEDLGRGGGGQHAVSALGTGLAFTGFAAGLAGPTMLSLGSTLAAGKLEVSPVLGVVSLVGTAGMYTGVALALNRGTRGALAGNVALFSGVVMLGGGVGQLLVNGGAVRRGRAGVALVPTANGVSVVGRLR